MPLHFTAMEHASTEIPGTIDGVTAGWMAAVSGLAIESVRHERIGEGIGVSSAVYRSHLVGDGVPESIVTKLPALAEEAVFTSTMLRMYIREVRFFEMMAADVPITVPRCFHAHVDPESSEFVVLMEDMGDLRIIDQVEGMGLRDAETAVDALAGWHAAFWGSAEPLLEAGAAVSLADPIYPAVLPVVFAEGWDKCVAAFDLPAEILDIGPGWVVAMPQVMQDLCAGPTTATHGDYRGDNLLFADDGSVVLLDFQLIGHASASYDLAYFITQSLEPDLAHSAERALFDRWVAALVDNGVVAADTEGLWDQYRRAAYFCLVYPIVASRGMDFEDPRQRALLDAMTSRFARAVRDLDLAEFGPS
jgi:Phosphotransferase enzyme family